MTDPERSPSSEAAAAAVDDDVGTPNLEALQASSEDDYENPGPGGAAAFCEWVGVRRSPRSYSFRFNPAAEGFILAEDFMPQVIVRGFQQAVAAQGTPLSISPHFFCLFRKALGDVEHQRWVSTHCFVLEAPSEEEYQRRADTLWSLVNTRIENFHSLGSGFSFYGFTLIDFETFKFTY